MTRPWSIQQLLLALATVAVLPFIGLTAYHALENSEAALAQARRQVSIVADGTADRLAAILQDNERILARLAERPLVRALDASACDPMVPEFVRLHPGYTTLAIRNPQGDALCSFIPKPIGRDRVSEFPWFREGIASRGFVAGNAFRGQQTGRWVSVLTYPVRDAAEALGGVLVLPLDLEALQIQVMGALPEHALVAVVDRMDQFLMRSDDQPKWVGSMAQHREPIAQARLAGSSFARVAGPDGIERVYALRVVPGSGWVAIAGIPSAIALSAHRKAIARDGALALAAALLSLALAWFMSRAIAAPVAALARTAHDIASGRTAARAPPAGPAEIRVVADEFNRMLDAREAETARVVESEQRFRGIVGTALDAIVTIDASQRIVQFNPAAEEMFGLPAQQAVGEPLERLLPERFRAAHAAHVLRFAESGVTTRRMGALMGLAAQRADGTEFPMEASISQTSAGDQRLYTAIVRDISERVAAERRIARLVDFYGALSRTNRALLQIREPQALYREICRICVEHGHARMAYIALVDGPRAVPAAWAGVTKTFLDDIDLPLDASVPQGNGPIARAIREGRHCIVNDYLADPSTLPWRERAAMLGTRATAAFPIRRAGAAIGALSLHVAEKDFFDAELIALLGEMAGDISFALDNLDRDRAHREAERTALESGAKLRLAVAAADLYAWDWDIPNDRLAWDRDPAALLGARPDPAAPYPDFRELVHPEDRERFLAAGRAALAGEAAYDLEFRLSALDGTLRWLRARGLVERDPRGAPLRLRGVSMDVTQRKRAESELVEAEARFRGLVEQAIAGIFILQDGTLQYANPRFAQILGYGDGAALLGRDAIGFVAAADRPRIAETMRRLAIGEITTGNVDFDVLRADRSIVHVDVHANRASHRGRPALIGLMQDISERKRAEEQIQHYVAQLQDAFMRTVEVATTLGEMRDPYTAGHERRVAEIAVAIGADLGFDAHRLEGLRVAGHLHDIGKITVPSEILAKPGRLSPAETDLVRQHARAGYDVLKAVSFPWPVAQATLQHHERLDGSGYPDGLRGDAICIEARILAVADTVEAMASHRPNRPGQGIRLALEEIERGRGSAYDPAVADACLKLFREKNFRIPD